MLNNASKLMLSFNSYFILLVIVLVEMWPTLSILQRIIGSAICAASLASFSILFYLRKENLPTAKRVSNSSSLSSDVIAYLFTYVIVFLGLTRDYKLSWISIALFTGVIAILFLRCEITHINPTLLLFGFKPYRVETEDGMSIIVLSRKSLLRRGADINLVELDQSLYIEAHND